jgi:ubiquinone/menaquinone biosynthesis C-methylase UbiE
MDNEKNVGEKVVTMKQYQQNNPHVTFGEKRRVRIRLFRNPGHRYTNWAWDVIAVGTGRTDEHFIPIRLMGELRKTLREAERFIKLRQWFWWFFKYID